MKTAALPYRTATLECIELGAWHYRRADGPVVQVEGPIAGWDYDLDLRLSRTFQLDAARLRGECGIGRDAVLQVCVVASSQAARYRSCVWHSTALTEGAAAGTIEFAVPGTALAESVALTTEVVLVSTRRGGDPFAAHLSGSRLVSDEVSVQLEGTGSRFPVETVDFESSLPHLRAPRALWHLSWSRGDLTVPAMRDLRLYLNSRHEALTAAAATADPNLVAMISVDVARQLIAGALDDEEFVADPAAFPEGSIGEVAQRLLLVCFPHMTASEVRAMRAVSPSKFEAMVQSGAGPEDVGW